MNIPLGRLAILLTLWSTHQSELLALESISPGPYSVTFLAPTIVIVE